MSYANKEKLVILLFFILILLFGIQNRIQDENIQRLENQIGFLQHSNVELRAFMNNQRNVDTDLHERINKLIRSIYPGSQ